MARMSANWCRSTRPSTGLTRRRIGKLSPVVCAPLALTAISLRTPASRFHQGFLADFAGEALAEDELADLARRLVTTVLGATAGADGA